MTLIKYSFDNLFWSSIFYTTHFEIQLKVWYKLDRFGISRLTICKSSALNISMKSFSGNVSEPFFLDEGQRGKSLEVIF